MTISMYQASVPPLVRSLSNLAAILEKGADHAESKKIDSTVLINSRLYPDMFALAKIEDDETNFSELITRLQNTTAYLKTFKPEQIDGSEDKSISLPMGTETLVLQGLPYLLSFILPNVYFHVTTAYNILRHSGVELGKLDFLGKP
jgi:uncharacterized protein